MTTVNIQASTKKEAIELIEGKFNLEWKYIRCIKNIRNRTKEYLFESK